jgi:hypothetical protein
MPQKPGIRWMGGAGGLRALMPCLVVALKAG